MDIAVEVGEELAPAGHVVGHVAVEVPPINLLIGGGAEEDTGTWLLQINIVGGLGAEGQNLGPLAPLCV